MAGLAMATKPLVLHWGPWFPVTMRLHNVSDLAGVQLFRPSLDSETPLLTLQLVLTHIFLPALFWSFQARSQSQKTVTITKPILALIISYSFGTRLCVSIVDALLGTSVLKFRSSVPRKILELLENLVDSGDTKDILASQAHRYLQTETVSRENLIFRQCP